MKTPPFHSNGLGYCMGNAGERVCTGARMGRSTDFPPGFSGKLRLARVRLDSGGYDRGGAYWGQGSPLFCAWADGVTIYKRAFSRGAAKTEILERIPSATFYR